MRPAADPCASVIKLYLGSDPDLTNNSAASLFEVRLWNVARTQAQIRSTLTEEINGPMPGLVAVWHLAGNAIDPVGGHNGGPPQGFAQYVALPAGVPCGLPTTDACLLGGRFDTSASFAVLSGPAADGRLTLTETGQANVRAQDDGSAVFSFFAPTDWEILAKMPADTCSLGNRYWFFSSAATNLHYSIVVFDLRTGAQKIYLNFSGPPAPAVTDTSAFATCP